MANGSEPLSIAVERHKDRLVVRLRGELDISTASGLANTLRAANSEIVIDLADLTFLDASGLGVLAQAEEHGDRLVIVNAGPLAQQIFQLTGLEHLLSGSDAP
jgi:anti-anti-sigma factor